MSVPVIILCGNVGCGKSTLASALMSALPLSKKINDDDVVKLLNNGEYGPWDESHISLYLSCVASLTSSCILADFPAIVDSAYMVDPEKRREFFSRLPSIHRAVYVVYRNGQEGLLNRQKNNRGLGDDYWQEVYDRIEATASFDNLPPERTLFLYAHPTSMSLPTILEDILKMISKFGV